MTCKRYYMCDLCGADIKQDTGIGIYHESGGAIRPVYFAKEGAGHHLCNGCVKGLAGMLVELEKMGEPHQ